MLETKFGLIERNAEIIRFDSNVDLKGIHFLTPLFNAIINKRVLHVKYKDFKSSEPYDVIFHPYYLKQFNNRWFVFGLNPDVENIYWNLALDRIESLSETSLEYTPTDNDWDDYFYDIVGVTRPQGVDIQEVVLNFSPVLAPYILTKPIHPSQKDKNEPSGLEVRIKVIPNIELIKLLLSFGDQVEVISPEHLRDTIKESLKKAYHCYEK